MRPRTILLLAVILQLPLATVAQRARRSALWLGEGVLQRSVPLPNQIRLKR